MASTVPLTENVLVAAVRPFIMCAQLFPMDCQVAELNCLSAQMHKTYAAAGQPSCCGSETGTIPVEMMRGSPGFTRERERGRDARARQQKVKSGPVLWSIYPIRTCRCTSGGGSMVI